MNYCLIYKVREVEKDRYSNNYEVLPAPLIKI
jgi:hypothetical protein